MTERRLELWISDFTGRAPAQPPDSLWNVERELESRLPCPRRLVLHKSILKQRVPLHGVTLAKTRFTQLNGKYGCVLGPSYKETRSCHSSEATSSRRPAFSSEAGLEGRRLVTSYMNSLGRPRVSFILSLGLSFPIYKETWFSRGDVSGELPVTQNYIPRCRAHVSSTK